MSDVSRDRTEEQESPIAEQTGSKRFEAGENLNRALKEEHDRRENEKSDTGYRDVGEDPTLPGQEEIVAQTPEHERLLKTYPTATSYGPDVNVVVPPEPPEPAPKDEEEEEESDEERDRRLEEEQEDGA